MEGKRLQLIILALLTYSVAFCGSLKIAAFNVEVFGRTKFSNAEVVSILTEVGKWAKEVCLCACIVSLLPLHGR